VSGRRDGYAGRSVSRGGFYAWLTRPRSARSRSDEDLAAKVRASFLASDRTYGARRVWHDLVAGGSACGLHRSERLMRNQNKALYLAMALRVFGWPPLAILFRATSDNKIRLRQIFFQ